jgi:hypothetical protein
LESDDEDLFRGCWRFAFLQPTFWPISLCAVNQRSSPNGTVTVRSYQRTSPNGTVTDNHSFKGNVNPSTGKTGTNYYIHDKTSPYYVGPASGHDSSN